MFHALDLFRLKVKVLKVTKQQWFAARQLPIDRERKEGDDYKDIDYRILSIEIKYINKCDWQNERFARYICMFIYPLNDQLCSFFICTSCQLLVLDNTRHRSL